MTCGTS